MSQFNYKRYQHPDFDGLSFDIWDSWTVQQNELEMVFTRLSLELPQLFFQTIGKTDEFSDAMSFYQFLSQQDDDFEYGRPGNTTAAGFPALFFMGGEIDFPSVDSHCLVVDVGPGILFFYLKTESADSASQRELIERVRDSLQF
ncbi:MAG: hypothetical protein K0U72_07295 [Gammaproteobacteria bacterium]|nr:hypothetical protein [Gammaproteobacteria bacterium]